MPGLELGQLAPERVVLGVGDLGCRLFVVETVVPFDLAAQRRDALRHGITSYGGHAGSGGAGRSRDSSLLLRARAESSAAGIRHASPAMEPARARRHHAFTSTGSGATSFAGG